MSMVFIHFGTSLFSFPRSFVALAVFQLVEAATDLGSR